MLDKLEKLIIALTDNPGCSEHAIELEVAHYLADKQLCQVKRNSYCEQTNTLIVKFVLHIIEALQALVTPQQVPDEVKESSLQIEHDIPLPTDKAPRKCRSGNPVRNMAIGDSIFMANSEHRNPLKKLSSMCQSEMDRTRDRTSGARTKAFTVRTVGDGEKICGARLWRVALN